MTRGSGSRPTAGDAMLRRPTVHPASLTLAQARAVFGASPKTHLLLLVLGEQLVGTLTRADVRNALEGSAPVPLGLLADRIVSEDAPLDVVRGRMIQEDRRRLAVVDDSMRLLGLLCLKRSRTGFCTDEGVAAMRAARRRPGAEQPRGVTGAQRFLRAG